MALERRCEHFGEPLRCPAPVVDPDAAGLPSRRRDDAQRAVIGSPELDAQQFCSDVAQVGEPVGVEVDDAFGQPHGADGVIEKPRPANVADPRAGSDQAHQRQGQGQAAPIEESMIGHHGMDVVGAAGPLQGTSESRPVGHARMAVPEPDPLMMPSSAMSIEGSNPCIHR